MRGRVIRSLIFNIAEIYIISMIGITLKVEWNYLIVLFLTFFISRFFFKNPLHYKKWYICAIWSTTLFVTLFLFFRADIYVSILSAVFCGFVTSGKSNIEDLFMYKSESKYKLLDEFIIYNYDDPRLLKYENYLKANDTLKYNLFILRFRQNRSWSEIKEISGISDTQKITLHLDAIYHALEINLMLKG